MMGVYVGKVCWLPVSEATAYFNVARATLKKKLENIGIVPNTVERISNDRLHIIEWAINLDRIHIVSHLIGIPLVASAPKYLQNKTKYKLVSKLPVKKR